MRENLKLRQKLTNEVVFERLPIVFQGFHPNVFSFSSEVCQWRELERNQRPDDWELLTQLGREIAIFAILGVGCGTNASWSSYQNGLGWACIITLYHGLNGLKDFFLSQPTITSNCYNIKRRIDELLRVQKIDSPAKRLIGDS